MCLCGGEGIGVSPNGTLFSCVAAILPDTALGTVVISKNTY